METTIVQALGTFGLLMIFIITFISAVGIFLAMSDEATRTTRQLGRVFLFTFMIGTILLTIVMHTFEITDTMVSKSAIQAEIDNIKSFQEDSLYQHELNTLQYLLEYEK